MDVPSFAPRIVLTSAAAMVIGAGALFAWQHQNRFANDANVHTISVPAYQASRDWHKVSLPTSEAA